jgi:hypothetical protein
VLPNGHIIQRSGSDAAPPPSRRGARRPSSTVRLPPIEDAAAGGAATAGAEGAAVNSQTAITAGGVRSISDQGLPVAFEGRRGHLVSGPGGVVTVAPPTVDPTTHEPVPHFYAAADAISS